MENNNFKWFSIKDCFPEVHVEKFITPGEEPGYFFSAISDELLVTDGQDVGIGFFTISNDAPSFFSDQLDGDITHWIPIPDLPASKKE